MICQSRAQGGFGANTIVTIRGKNGEIVDTVVAGILDAARDRLLGNMAHYEHAGVGHCRVVRKADDRHIGWSGFGTNRDHIAAHERAQDQLVAIRYRLARSLLRTLRRIVGGDPKIARFRVEDRHCGRIGNGLPDIAVLARKWHQQRDTVNILVLGEGGRARLRRRRTRGGGLPAFRDDRTTR